MPEEFRTRAESDLQWEAHDKLHLAEEKLDRKDFQNVESSIDDYKESHERVHDIHAHAHDREHFMTNLAITKAEESMNQRLEGMNQFREQLNSQTQSFVTREIFDKYSKDVDSKMEIALQSVADKNEALVTSLANRHDADYNSIRELIQSVKDAIQAEKEARKTFEGSINTWKWIAGFLGASGVAGVILLFAQQNS